MRIIPPTYNLPPEKAKELSQLQQKWSKNQQLRDSNPRWKENIWRKIYRCFLMKLQSGCCAYCDTLIVNSTNGQVEHFLPKSIYYKRKFCWDNWLLICKNCNVAKSTVDPQNTPIIDPRKDNPAILLDLLPTGTYIPKKTRSLQNQKKSENSIHYKDLNCKRTRRSVFLKEHRRNSVCEIQKLIEMYNRCKKIGNRELIDVAKKNLIQSCSSHTKNFTGAALVWLLKKVHEGEIERTIYDIALRKYKNGFPQKENVFSCMNK